MPSIAPAAANDSEYQHILSNIFTAKTSQASLEAAIALSNRLSSLPSSSLHHTLQVNILPVLVKNAQDKKSAVNRESGLIALGSLFETLPTSSAMSYLLLTPTLSQVVFDSLADTKNGPVKEAAEYAIQAIYTILVTTAASKVNPISTELGVSYLSSMILTNYLTSSKAKPQGKIGALDLLSKLADRMVSLSEDLGDDFGRELMGRQLEGLIKGVEGGLFDVKADVAKAAVNCLTKLTGLVGNEDVRPHMPMLVKTLREGSHQALAKAIHDLSQTTFVALVTSPLLSLLTPILERVLGSPQTGQEVLRQTVVVAENLTKLVHDPIEAREFLPRLLPGVERVEGFSSLPEVRHLAKGCVKVMRDAMKLNDGEEDTSKRFTKEEVRAKLEELVGANILAEEKKLWNDTVRDVISELVKDIVAVREWERVKKVLVNLLSEIIEGGYDTAAIISETVASWFEEEYIRRFGALTAPKIVHNPEEVEIVNATFSLAYGGMMLLNHTNLRLVRGHRYGLCGHNGAGKSTLMRSIAEGKLEGFPSKDELRTCFVEHKMQGEEGDTDILTFISRSLIKAGYVEVGNDLNKVREVLEHVGFDKQRFEQNVGALSGGWKMKLALAEAMLMKADVLLLDEPTNHLDVTNVKWLQNYLKSHTDITSLIVSHDSGFLDEVCTDIIHYENKKLVHYKGNLSEFVKVRPEGKAYYTLSATNVQFRFPSPGILAGVKSMTRSILKMTNVTYTYPGASKPSLVNASISVALSSRTAILGPNGAGKSTLIKLLTGELIPQLGVVEKHPQLRIGYVAQHSLKHVEMHLEKSPSQYLQWRYASGADKEVAMKESRKLTVEDLAQLDKMVDIGDGKPKRIDLLVGRQKYKKSYQYEVQWQGLLPKHNTMVSRETLLKLGFHKLVQEFDDKESAREGLGYRELTAQAIREHYEKCGVPGDIAEHNEIAGLSGGQKVKVVLAACLWTLPHILVLDEPSNYLDRDSLGALSLALSEFKGGCLIISHNSEFVSSICTEQIHVDNGRIVGRTGGLPNVGGLTVQDGTGSGNSSVRPGSSAVSSMQNSPVASAYNSGQEDNAPDGESMQFKGRKFAKKKKLTRAQLKEREVRRRLRYIEWLNSPKGTPRPPDTDDEE
ncbi:P-loop containing nucleoside triphosphate hydrolase protein [Kalaharituber pfeilii]|nr:P-loop containing nucleoside triphosphate hydrolase protein [Kalaharituber pfeilii]